MSLLNHAISNLVSLCCVYTLGWEEEVAYRHKKKSKQRARGSTARASKTWSRCRKLMRNMIPTHEGCHRFVESFVEGWSEYKQLVTDIFADFKKHSAKRQRQPSKSLFQLWREKHLQLNVRFRCTIQFTRNGVVGGISCKVRNSVSGQQQVITDGKWHNMEAIRSSAYC
ncbi:Hypothetical predicted protein [Pelobates cultripes]|uniref:Uncharacterized protein n=1 Tax=Pelobates cultripes TaxID=61616 RepID=A0AAD1QX18_PELCU|nr:Hypothetical predicted protein [Pelobates cultripes]